MKKKRIFTIAAIAATLVLFLVGVALADLGPLFTRNVSGTPDGETGSSQMTQFSLYVPAQNTARDLLGVDTDIDPITYLVGDDDCTYNNPDACDEVVYTELNNEIRPLLASYNDGIEHPDPGLFGPDPISSEAGVGERDAFAALSLDDGATWRNYNLSNSADLSSFVLQTTGEDFVGDVYKVAHTVVGNRVVVAWLSRYCSGGSPLYSWDDGDDLTAVDADELLLDWYPELATDNIVTVYPPNDVEYDANKYTIDLFGVAGAQKSVDYTAQGFPEVGEIPYGCVWAARGTLEPVVCDKTDPENVTCDYELGVSSSHYDIVWRQPERLTSGRRDPNRLEISGAQGAGFSISWQEDPEGLRPGQGLGPGEGWAGAVANAKTDVWYTYIDWDHFDDICQPSDVEDEVYCTPDALETLDLSLEDATKPKIAVPFAIPMRLTDNNLCKSNISNSVDPKDDSNPYCYTDFDDNGIADLCASSISWTNPGDTTLEICQTEDLRVLNGGTASTRARWAIKPYTNIDGETSAWVSMGEEKMKALGEPVSGDPDGVDEEDILDIGKNVWYHTFEFNNPEIVQQGLMLNAPAFDPETGELFPAFTDDDLEGYDYEYYETEIARRFNIMVQGVGDADESVEGTSGILIYKQGILNQGGPADIFIRRMVLPDDFDPAVDNPFAYENVDCSSFDDLGVATPVDLEYPDGVNPNYVRGLCPNEGMNVSGTSIVECDGVVGDCSAEFPWDGAIDPNSYPKVTRWVQTLENYNDPTWENPYDVSKGHRGFIDGDFVFMMYATAPNWKANTTGNEAYNLYIRRSFDGGITWTTTPASLGGDDTETCEDYGWGGTEEVEVCTTYGAGEFEQARNVSRLIGSRITVLDPRYSPTGGVLKTDFESLVCDDDGDGEWTNCLYETDPYGGLETRNPSVFFVTYETGDNTVVDEETGAVPMDMYYSKGFNWGDDYEEINVCDVDTASGETLPSECESESDEVWRWDWLEQGPPISEEASVTATPAGDRFYAVWNSELEIALDTFTDMDSIFRRIFYDEDRLYLFDFIPEAEITSVSDQSPFDDEPLILTGAAWDNDPFGNPQIVDYEWTYAPVDEVTAAVLIDDDGDGDPLTLSLAAGSLEPGEYTFSFRAQDNEGNWSEYARAQIHVRHKFKFFFPFFFKP